MRPIVTWAMKSQIISSKITKSYKKAILIKPDCLKRFYDAEEEFYVDHGRVEFSENVRGYLNQAFNYYNNLAIQ